MADVVSLRQPDSALEGEVALAVIRLPSRRLRRLRQDVVNDLAQSMSKVGLIQAISVSEDGMLIAGVHRYHAASKLGWQTIRTVLVEDRSADLKRIMAIDENLVRADLSPAENAAHHAERQKLHEGEFPETRPVKVRGGPGRGKKTNDTKSSVSYTTSAAKQIGVNVRTVQRAVARGAIPNVLDAAGTSLDKPAELDALRELSKPQQKALIARAKAGEKVSAKTTLKKLKREERERALAGKQTALPDVKFGVIVEDFEWDFEVWSRDTGMDRHAANHYPVSEEAHTVDEILKRTNDRFACAADDCVLLMWATVPHLAVAIDLLRRRGFKYVSNYAWGKNKAGTGYWNRNKHEHLLIGVKGNIPAPAPGTQWDSLVMAPVGKHSAKPERFLEMVEQYFPTLPKIELNRRGSPRPGWHGWGLEAEAAE